jgi:hypothetical protein
MLKIQYVVAGVAALALCGVAQARTPLFGYRTYNGGYTYTHADLNNDGREDLVIPTLTGFSVVLSTGDATYGAKTNYTVPNSDPSGVVLLDLNNDGKMDVIAYNSFASGFYEYLNNGNGTFHLQATVTPANIQHIQAIAVGDFNHDGYVDVAITDASSLHILFNNHSQGWSIGPTTSVPGISELSVGDFDGDGMADIASSTTQATYLYFGDNTGHFTVVNATMSAHPMMFLMDLNGDGKSDLVGAAVASSNQGVDTYYHQLWVIYGNASRAINDNGIELGWYVSPFVSGEPAPSPVVDVADFNGDGVQDFTLVESQNADGSGYRRLVVMTGKATGGWNPEQVLLADNDLDSGVAVIRANRDNRPDILVDSFANNATTAHFMVNDTSGGFYGGCGLPNASKGIYLCSSTTASSTSVTFRASAAGPTTMRKMEVWVDGAKKFEQVAYHDFSHYAFLDKTLTLSKGTHKVAIYAASYDNMLQKNVYTFTVQ